MLYKHQEIYISYLLFKRADFHTGFLKHDISSSLKETSFSTSGENEGSSMKSPTLKQERTPKAGKAESLGALLFVPFTGFSSAVFWVLEGTTVQMGSSEYSTKICPVCSMFLLFPFIKAIQQCRINGLCVLPTYKNGTSSIWLVFQHLSLLPLPISAGEY